MIRVDKNQLLMEISGKSVDEISKKIDSLENILKEIELELSKIGRKIIFSFNMPNKKDATQYRKILRSRKEEVQTELEFYKNKKEELVTFGFDNFIRYLLFVLSQIEKKEFIAVYEKGLCTIKSVQDSKLILKLPYSEKINLLSASVKDQIESIHPAFHKLLTDIINLRNNYKFKSLDEEQIFKYLYMTFDINYSKIFGDSSILMDEKLSEIANSLALDISGDNSAKTLLYRLSTEELIEVLHGLKKGDYNNLCHNEYWFDEKLDKFKISRWHIERKKLLEKGILCPEITMENYIAFCCIDQIIGLAKSIEKERYISLYGKYQTPASEEELKIIEALKEEILKINYNWREAREINRNLARLSIYDNCEFPHNTRDIANVFAPKIVTFYDRYENKDLKGSTSELRDRAQVLYESLDSRKLYDFFSTQSKDSIDDYLKRMILSQFDIPKIIYKHGGGLFKEKLELVKEELELSFNLSPETLDFLFGNSLNTKILVSLAKGVLYSLCSTEKVDNILETCIKLQKSFGCWNGIVSYNDYNSLRLPNGDIIYSILCEDIKEIYSSYQKQLNYLMKSENDLEFIEGCVEISGDVLMTQIFREGNKRTSKCLFNALLMSRGIIPPVVDLNQNETEFFEKFAYGRYDRYLNAKDEILKNAVITSDMLKNDNYFYPLNVSMDAVNRSEFRSYAY